MEKFNIVITPYAETQLRETVDYISLELANPMAARLFIDQIRAKVSNLGDFPEAYPIVDKTPWREKGVRKLIVKSFIVYFWINSDKREVNVLSVVYGKMDQLKQLQKMVF